MYFLEVAKKQFFFACDDITGQRWKEQVSKNQAKKVNNTCLHALQDRWMY